MFSNCQNIMCTSLANLVVWLLWNDCVTSVPKYGQKAARSTYQNWPKRIALIYSLKSCHLPFALLGPELTVKDSRFISSFGTFKPQKLV